MALFFLVIGSLSFPSVHDPDTLMLSVIIFVFFFMEFNHVPVIEFLIVVAVIGIVIALKS